MKGWIIVNGFLYTDKFSEIAEMFVNAAKAHRIVLDIKSNTEIVTGIFEMDKSMEKPDFVLFWDKDIILAKYLEISGIPVFNNSEAIEICDDKRKAYAAFLKAGLPIPPTVSAPMTYASIGFSSLKFVKQIITRLGYPVILKEAFGSFGDQVYKVDDPKTLKRMLLDLQETPFLFQKYISTSHGQDVRIQVVGGKVIASMRRFSDKDFRANITYGGSKEKYEPDENACKLAIAACKAVGCDFGGVDLLFGKKGFLVCEVNSNAHFKNLYDCTGVNAADAIIEYIIGKLDK